MRVFKAAKIDTGKWGLKQVEMLEKFVNDNNIKQEDIVKIIWTPGNTIVLCYYTSVL